MTVPKEQFIVAIGASAGGLEAIHEFFDHMPDNTSLSFVLIQHLSSDYKSLLVELVSRHTHMKVSEATHNTAIRPNKIYVIPNNKFITINNNRLILEEKTNLSSPNNAIDTFLYSLARDKKDRAIAVILSGTGTDGTRGIEAVKRNGGLVLVQDPATAKFDGMPNSAIHLGIADQILSPREMPQEILEHTREPLINADEFKDEELTAIFSLIQQTVGFDFHLYKLPTLLRRITRRMMQLNYRKLGHYIQLLKNDPNECRALGNDFLIGVTRFFRDREAFRLLEEKVLVPLVKSKEPESSIKVWICACSTGEEAYSVAILLSEILEKFPKSLELKIFATDVDQASLDIASRGIYPETITKDVSAPILEKYFLRRGSQYQIIQRIRKQIVFARHDVINDPPFINNDLVSCRNMLIYVNQHLQQKIYALLLYSLNPDGYLFLGPSEHSTFIRENVKELSSEWKLYKKVREARLASQYLTMIGQQRSVREHRRPIASNAVAEKPKGIWNAVQEALMEDLNIAAFFIDQQFSIRDSAGNFERFLALPKKSLQLNLLNMVPKEIYFVFSTEIKRAWKEGKPVTIRNIKYRKGESLVSWQVVIRPMEPFTLIIITEQEVVEHMSTDNHALQNEPQISQEDYINVLENELAETRSNLHLAVEDLETTNEELQSTNEELLSANEELQSSNEELQSLNEELHTLNTEHQLKIRELIELNDDLNNYFRSTDIAQIFLDKSLRIRKFNPASAALVNLIESDIGRPLAHISNNIRHENFLPDIEHVLRTREVMERQVALSNGKQLLMRILPYVNRDREINGIIVTFVDITTTTQLNNIIRAVLNSSPGYIFAFTAVRHGKTIVDFSLQTVNNAAAKFLNLPVANCAGISLTTDIPLLTQNNLFDHYVKVVDAEVVLNKDIFYEPTQRWFTLIATKMMDGFVVSLSDITSKKRSEQRLKKNYLELISVKDNLKKVNEQLENKVAERTRELAASEERFRLVARATNDALWDWDFVRDSFWLGETFYKLFAYEKISEVTSIEYWKEKVHPEDMEQVTQTLYNAINSGQTQWTKEYRFRKADGEYAYILDRAYILHDEFGTPYRMLGSMFDVTQLKIAEQKLATMNEQLELKVLERTRELEQINAELELSNHDLQQFASVASHDLQEPLRKIQMFAGLIRDTYGDDPQNPSLRFIHKILNAAGRMRSLITDILNYSRLSADDNTCKPTSLTSLVKGILDDFELTIREKNASIEVAELPEIEVNPGQIRQVFQNLVSNALKFSKPNLPPVIRINCQRIAKRSFMSMPQADGPFWLFTITDNGIGFNPQFTANIFNLFQRLHSKDRFEGTGIGLAITKKIIEKHNGSIRADSKEGQGATFSFILPAHQNGPKNAGLG